VVFGVAAHAQASLDEIIRYMESAADAELTAVETNGTRLSAKKNWEAS